MCIYIYIERDIFVVDQFIFFEKPTSRTNVWFRLRFEKTLLMLNNKKGNSSLDDCLQNTKVKRLCDFHCFSKNLCSYNPPVGKPDLVHLVLQIASLHVKSDLKSIDVPKYPGTVGGTLCKCW